MAGLGGQPTRPGSPGRSGPCDPGEGCAGPDQPSLPTRPPAWQTSSSPRLLPLLLSPWQIRDPVAELRRPPWVQKDPLGSQLVGTGRLREAQQPRTGASLACAHHHRRHHHHHHHHVLGSWGAGELARPPPCLPPRCSPNSCLLVPGTRAEIVAINSFGSGVEDTSHRPSLAANCVTHLLSIL